MGAIFLNNDNNNNDLYSTINIYELAALYIINIKINLTIKKKKKRSTVL